MQNQPFMASLERLSSSEFARALRIKVESLRSAVCRNGGTYYGIKPIRLPNGRLSWPADAVERLLRGGEE
jgi:hypothetical protein